VTSARRPVLATFSHAKRRHAAFYSGFLEQVQELYFQGGESAAAALAKYDLDAQNVSDGIAWAVKRWPRDREAARVCSAFMGGGMHVLDFRLSNQERVHLLRAAVEAARSLGDLHAQGVHLGNLGLAYASLGQLDEALECHEQALRIDVQTGRHRGRAASRMNMASVHYRRGDFAGAIAGYEASVDEFRALGLRRGEAEALGNLGLIYTDLLRIDDAERVLREQLRISREEGDRVGAANALGCLGVLCDLRQDYPSAVELYEESLRESRAIGDLGGQAVRLGNLGLAYEHLGDRPRALDLFHEQLRIARQTGSRDVEGDALANLASVHDHAGEHERALVLYQQSIAAARETGDVHGQAIRIYNRSVTLARVSGPGAAAEAATPALVLLEMLGSPHAGKVTTRIALWRIAYLGRMLAHGDVDAAFYTAGPMPAFVDGRIDFHGRI
jgi:tetratricopeptide (TPR) repeat protein